MTTYPTEHSAIIDISFIIGLTDKAISGGKMFAASAARLKEQYGTDMPWVIEPSGALSFDKSGSVAMPAIGNTATILTFNVPQGYDGTVKRMSINYNGPGFTNDSGDVIFSVTTDDSPMRNYERLTRELGTEQFPRQINGFRVYSGQVIAITVTHVANITLAESILATIAGYFYPVE